MWFHFISAVNLLRNRTPAALRMILVASLGIVWCVGGFVLALGTWRDLDRQASSVQMEVVMKSELQSVTPGVMARELRRIPSVLNIEIVYPEQSWREFANDLELSDELREVVVLPTILRITPRRGNVNGEWLNTTARSITGIYSTSVEKVVWSEDYVRLLDARRSDVMIFGGVAGVFSVLIFLFAMQFAFRAELIMAVRDLRVVGAMGASATWMAIPHMLFSLLCGALGLGIASLFLFLIWPTALVRAPWLITVSATEIYALTAVIVGLGVISICIQAVVASLNAVRVRSL